MNRHFANQVQKIRLASKLDQTQFGELFGVAQSSVTRWENGSIPRGDRLNKIADYAKMSLEELVGDLAPEMKRSLYTSEGVVVSEATLVPILAACLPHVRTADWTETEVQRLARYVAAGLGFLVGDPANQASSDSIEVALRALDRLLRDDRLGE